MIILRRDVVRLMREGLERLVGDQAAPFLSYIASGIGVYEGSIFRESAQSAGEQQSTHLEDLVHSAFEGTNLGLGKIHVGKLDFDEGTLSVSVANCFEAVENGPSESPNCMFTGGFLAGLFAEVFDKTVQANEVRCISKGDPECEFQVSPIDKKEPETVPTTPAETIGPSEKEGEPIASSPPTEKNSPPAAPVEARETKSAVGSKPVASETPPGGSGAGTGKIQEPSHPDLEAGVERASRIAKRKQGFWERLFKKS